MKFQSFEIVNGVDSEASPSKTDILTIFKVVVVEPLPSIFV
jgi:hypothetical protein